MIQVSMNQFMQLKCIVELNNTNSSTRRANLFTLVFGKQTLVSKNG